MPTPVLGRNHGDNSTINSIGTSSLKYNIINRTTMIQLQNHNERSMATSNRKVIDAKNAKRLKIQQKKKKGLPNKKKSPQQTDDSLATATTTDDIDGSGISVGAGDPFLQHQEWVKFQQSITVAGFQTGQVTTATAFKKSRGGKQARRKREKELARLGVAEEEGSTGATGSAKLSAVAAKFPAIRYSPEETEELLKQAYAALPPRSGKRGTRNLRRQETRWRKVRKIRSDYKANIINAHYRKMDHRKYKRDRTKQALDDSIEQRRRDLHYQGQVLKRWMDNFQGGKFNNNAS